MAWRKWPLASGNTSSTAVCRCVSPPLHPEHVLQTSTLDLALRQTQTYLCALPTDGENRTVTTDDSFNIVERPIQSFANTGALRYLVSTFDPCDGYLKDYEEGRGRRVVTFNNILRDKVFPLAPAIDFMLRHGQAAMQRPIEIEFAGNIAPDAATSKEKGHIYWLQIRPIIDRKELVTDAMLDSIPEDSIILRSTTAIGNGNVDGISAIVYVRPDAFDSAENRSLVDVLDKLNREFIERGENYILIGPGRWGSSDSALGIPVKWADISGARLIVEASLDNYRIEPSQGTHFFHNLTSFGVGYFTIDSSSPDALYDHSRLDAMQADYDDGRIRVVRFDRPLTIAINGRRGVGIVAVDSPADNNLSTDLP